MRDLLFLQLKLKEKENCEANLVFVIKDGEIIERFEGKGGLVSECFVEKYGIQKILSLYIKKNEYMKFIEN